MLLTLLPWLPLAAKLLLTAAIVVTASITTERAGPFIGGLVVTLPVTVWPAYLFLTMDHDLVFVADSVVGGMVMHAVTAVLMLVYVLMAQRFRLAPSLAAAVGVWVLLGIILKSVEWSFLAAGLLNLIAYPACMWIARPYRDAPMPKLQRRWYDIPARVLFVCSLMSTILLVSNWAGPVATGFIAVFPISTVSAVLILNPRIGEKATAAMVANGMRGMSGIALGLPAVHLTVVPLGPVVALTLLIAIPVAWSLLAWFQRERTRRVPARP
jgi:hypothetical protein